MSDLRLLVWLGDDPRAPDQCGTATILASANEARERAEVRRIFAAIWRVDLARVRAATREELDAGR